MSLAASAQERTSQTPMSRVPDLPVWVLIPAALVLALNVLQLVIGAWQSSPTSDASTYVLWLQNLLTNGSYSFPNSGTHEGHGPISALLQHVSAILFGTESWSETQWTAESNSARHLAIAVMSISGLAGAAVCTGLLLRSWRWGVVAATTLSAVPSWTGHGMFNTTDVPAAAGYTLVTASTVLVIRPLRSPARTKAGAFALAWLGWILAFGSRPGLWPALVVSIALGGVAVWMRERARYGESGHRFAPLFSIVPLLGGALFGYLSLWVVDPRGHGNVLQTLWVAITSSSRFPFSGSVLVNGRVDPMPPKWTYVFEWYVHQIPLLILAAAVLFVGVWLLVILRDGLPMLRRNCAFDSSAFLLGSAVVVAQATLLPALGIVLASTFYNATRQLLFVLPALAVLATLGFAKITEWSAFRFRNAGRRWSYLVMLVAVALPSVVQFRMFPYNYVYFNPLAEARGVDNAWSVDYWRASTRDLMRKTPAGFPRDCDPWNGTSLDQCADYPDFALYTGEVGMEAGLHELKSNQYYLMRYTEFGTALPNSCIEVDSVRRPLTFTTITMGVVGVCDFPLVEQSGRELDFALSTEGGRPLLDERAAAALLWGWQVDSSLGVWANWETAGLGWSLDDDLRGKALELQIGGRLQSEEGLPREVRVRVNGEDVGKAIFTAEVQDRWQKFAIPIEVAMKLDGDFVVELSDEDRSRGPLVYFLNSIKVTPEPGFGNRT